MFYSNFVPKTRRFWDIKLVTILWPWNPGYGSLSVIGTNTDRSAAYDFLLTFYSNHGPISYTVFEINGDFHRKPQIFPTPCILHPTEGGYRADKKVWLYLQPSGYNTPTWRTDRQTDGRTPGDSKDRAYAERRAVKIRPADSLLAYTRDKNCRCGCWQRVPMYTLIVANTLAR